METRKVCYTELAYVLGIVTLALGIALFSKNEKECYN